MGEAYAETGPFASNRLPISRAGFHIECLEFARITSVSAFRGEAEGVAAQLREQIGIEFPKPGWSASNGTSMVAWFQADQWMVFGPEIALSNAAMTDQTDGWAGLAVTGDLVCDAMDRLSAINVRSMVPGQVARTELAHQMGLAVRTETGVQVWVMRSLARDFLNHLETTLGAIAAISTRMRD